MSEFPLVSICVLAYNHEKYIRDAINGILSQKCGFNYEIVLSNDSSTDHTHEIIQDILNEHPMAYRIRYFNNEKNIGMISNFINTLENCNGKYIAICDGDDYWTDNLKLQKQIDFLENNLDYIACFHNAQVIENGKFTKPYHSWEENKNIDIRSLIVKGGGIFPSSSIIYRNEIDIPEFDFDIKAGDTMLLYLILNKGMVFYLKDNMCIYRKHDQGVYSSIKNDKKKIYDDIKSNLKLNFHFKKMYPTLISYFNESTQNQLKRLSNNVGSLHLIPLFLDGSLDFQNLKAFLSGKFKSKLNE